MASYYVEELNDKVELVMAQDATGIYVGRLRGSTGTAGKVGISRYRRPWKDSIWLPEWGNEVKEVSTTDNDYLDFVRRMERNSYMTTTPSEIRAMAGSAEEVIRKVIGEAGDAVTIFPFPFLDGQQ